MKDGADRIEHTMNIFYVGSGTQNLKVIIESKKQRQKQKGRCFTLKSVICMEIALTAQAQTS